MMVRSAVKQPRGLTVVAVLICLIIVTLIGAALIKLGVAQRGLARDSERRLQAEWLAESGAQRALARLVANRDYTGETWSLAAADFGQSERPAATTQGGPVESAAAVVTIAVERVPAEPNRRRVRIAADYPRDPPRRARHTKQIMIDLEPSERGAVP